MPKAVIARFDGICGRCGRVYTAGSQITYGSMSKKGKWYHFPSCSDAIAAGPAVTPLPALAEPVEAVTSIPPAPPATPAEATGAGWAAGVAGIDAAQILSMLTALLSNGQAAQALPFAQPAPVASPVVLVPVKATKQVSGISNRSKWWEVLEACLKSGLTRILLVGPPGTGKSTTADRDAQRVTCHEDAGPESIVGTFIQKDGNTIWIDGPAVRAMRTGSRVVLDETDHLSPECVSLLYALLDDAPSIMLPTGECVRATSGYQVIGTSNSSPSDFPEAILDRFEAVLVAHEPHPGAVDIVRSHAGDRHEALVGLMTNYYRAVDKKIFEFRGSPTLRKCRNYAKLTQAGMNSEIAARCVFGAAGAEIVSAMTTSGVVTPAGTEVNW